MKLQKYLRPSIKGLLEGTVEEEEESHNMGMVYDFLHMSSVSDGCVHAVCVRNETLFTIANDVPFPPPPGKHRCYLSLTVLEILLQKLIFLPFLAAHKSCRIL